MSYDSYFSQVGKLSTYLKERKKIKSPSSAMNIRKLLMKNVFSLSWIIISFLLGKKCLLVGEVKDLLILDLQM